jgi:pSer/pThr/pTyr-binding forkhead associated (FHA) protein
MGQILFRALAAGVAGLLAWVIVEPMFPSVALDPSWAGVERIFMLLLGGFVGLALGALQGWSQGSRVHMLRGALLGGALGAFGAFLGYAFGGSLLARMFPSDIFMGTHPFPIVVMARILALAPIGLLLGAAIGVGGLTPRRIAVGAIGGLIGGLAAGAIFDVLSVALAPILLELRGGAPRLVEGIPTVSGEIGVAGRAVTGLAVGLFIGLFIGIVDRVTRTAWIRLVLGRNEGREWVVDAAQTFLGRNERAHVPLFGDPTVAPMHACVVRQGDLYTLMDGGTPLGTFLNGQRVVQAPLFDGAHIQIGPHVLMFSLRHGSAPQRASEAYRGAAYPAQQSPQTAIHAQAAVPPQPVSNPTVAVPAASAPAEPALGLVAVDGPLVGQRFDVRSPIEVGRESPGIPLGFDSSASRRHARLAPVADGIAITDLGSTNGTLVNGARVSATTLKPGDLVKIGATTFRVEGSA